MAGIFTYNPYSAFAADYFAFLADRFYRWSNFHNLTPHLVNLFLRRFTQKQICGFTEGKKASYLSRQTIRPFVKS